MIVAAVVADNGTYSLLQNAGGCDEVVQGALALFDDVLRSLSFLQARGSDLRVHYKNTHETARAVAGMPLKRAVRYLKAVSCATC